MKIIFFLYPGNYKKGLKWYRNRFPKENQIGRKTIVMEDSSVYFFGEQAPRRMRNLLPHSKMMAILKHPGDRAYSFYHHRRACGDKLALKYSFHEAVRSF